MIHIQQFTFNAFQTRCCAVWDEAGFCAFVDPGCSTHSEFSELTGFVSSRGLKPVCIMLTHAHFDHIYGVSELSRLYGGLPVYMHEAESYTLENTNPYVCRAYGLPLPDLSFTSGTMKPEASPAAEGSGLTDGHAGLVTVAEGDVISVGGLRFEVIETPGHSRGGLCFFERTERVLFSGDTLFAGAIGRTDHPGGDYEVLMRSILEKLLPLDDSKTPVKVIPGHGPCTDLATEGMTNPFLQPFNLPYDD